MIVHFGRFAELNEFIVAIIHHLVFIYFFLKCLLFNLQIKIIDLFIIFLGYLNLFLI